MKSMLHLPSMGSSLARLKNHVVANDAGMRWALRDDGPAPLGAGAPRDLLLVPSEHLLLMVVALPLPSRRKRLEALPFAIEDRIAEPLDAVHLALGEVVAADGRHLACVVDHARMADWVAAAEAAGLARAAIMPDALALPVPAEGRWMVYRDGARRCVVRTADGGGFAATTDLTEQLWAAAGSPPCDETPALDGGAIALDLRQGRYAPRRDDYRIAARRAAIVAAAGLLAHGAIAAADTIVLRSIAAKRGAEMIGLLAQAAPGAYTGADPHDAADVAAELLPAGGAAPGPMMPLLVQTSRAMTPFGGAVAVRAMRYDETAASLALDLASADPDTVAALLRAVRDAGLVARLDGTTLSVSAGPRR